MSDTASLFITALQKKMKTATWRTLYRRRKAWGLTASIDLSGCDHQMIQSPKAIKGFVSALVKEIKMKAYGGVYLKKFGDDSLEGYSAIQFIETSSITVHFDDKIADRAFIDIFSCQFFDPAAAEKFAKNYFRAKKSRIKIFLRY